MDDPWGSPWATNDSNPALEPLPRALTNLELPGRTLHRNRSATSISPWAVEDDVLNAWATPEPARALAPTAATPTTPWSGWGGEHGLNSSQISLTGRAREGSLGLPSPTAWPSSASLAPPGSKTLSRRSSALSLSRQPSPDPWAAEFSQNRLSLPAPVHIPAEQAAISTLETSAEVEEDDEYRKNTDDDTSPRAEIEDAHVRDLDATPVPDPGQDVEVQPENGGDNEPRDQKDQEEEPPDSPSASRHSSISNDSRHDERLDSPITSMDEDCKDRPPMLRRPSTKVQELVDKFDGLAKKTDDTLLAPVPVDGRRRSASRSVSMRSFRTDATSDFGDFEDAEDLDSLKLPRKSSVTGSPRPPSSHAGRLRSASKSSLRNAAVAPVIASPIREEAPNRFQELRAKFGPVSFTPDLELVDKLFDVAKLDEEQPSTKDYSLDAVDGIIRDSFTTVSERKTWYRISRPGTMRKHDMGDDDNYRRVTWVGSKVRENAGKIVRRWMEEGSYAGRPSNGGRPMAKGGAFNWDAKAEPLSFDKIFGKRKSVQPPKPEPAQSLRPLSLQPQPTAPAHSRNPSAGVKSLPPRSPLSIPAPPAGPAFGWSTGANDSSAPASARPSIDCARQSLEVGSIRSGHSRAASVQESESRSSLHLTPPPSVSPPQPLKPSNTSVLAIDEDDDEEWGEMIASPATDSRPGSTLFDGSMNGSIASLPFVDPAASAALAPTSTASDAVPVNGEPVAGKDLRISTTPSADIWDFSAFDNKPAARAIPPSTTSKPEFTFDTPIPSPTLSISSRTGSPASFQLPKPPTPVVPSRISSPTSPHVSKSPAPSVPSRTGSPTSFHMPKPPTPSVPLRPHHTPKSSLNLVRPSPLHNVITPKVASPEPVTSGKPPDKSVSFAQDDDEYVDEPAVRRIVTGLPDLSYLLR